MKKLFSKIKSVKQKIDDNIFLKIVRISIKVILYALVLTLLAIIIFQKVSDNKASFGGYNIYTVISGSMLPEYEIGDILLSEKVDIKDIKIGDDITYLGDEGNFKGKIVTHRVINSRYQDNIRILTTKGLANPKEDPEVKETQVLGKVAYKFVILSFLSKLMLDAKSYFIICFIAALIFSIQVVGIIFDKDDDDEDDDELDDDEDEEDDDGDKD